MSRSKNIIRSFIVNEKDSPAKAKVRAEYKKEMELRSKAFQKFSDIKHNKYDGSSDRFYNDDITTYQKLRGEIDKHASAADKHWDKLQKMK